ncbi:hypothetical protein QO002_000059 [Pararhizobium capsulatum DSM 1112]|uniref:Uncharacterized protein n=1 Tax=Pararhizobium capsulatum DSM 1112 TaxID=1121113 RepID=A0ABU0BI37_9HYPH|nr:hypothetical protein [Pararhizobium capsulatum]MDQ0317921.1 hypothetical protein [Pararhizobium capsulatum DSM 1112]
MKRLAAAVLFSLAPLGVQAADCLQSKAVYGDADGAYELRFLPVDSESATTSNRFEVAALKADLKLEGFVMISGDPERANGMIMNNCPEGDVTGDDLAACVIWQGVIYSVDAAGKVDLLPAETKAAALQLLLPDLGPAIKASALWGKLTVAPWDVFGLKGCAT